MLKRLKWPTRAFEHNALGSLGADAFDLLQLLGTGTIKIHRPGLSHAHHDGQSTPAIDDFLHNTHPITSTTHDTRQASCRAGKAQAITETTASV
jgi:hypothetical protein